MTLATVLRPAAGAQTLNPGPPRLGGMLLLLALEPLGLPCDALMSAAAGLMAGRGAAQHAAAAAAVRAGAIVTALLLRLL